MTTDCKHARIQTWRFGDNEVAGMWSCADCERRFEPAAPVVAHACTTSAVVDRVPLTTEQIDTILDRAGVPELPPEWARCDYEIARAIEAAHGITAAKEHP